MQEVSYCRTTGKGSKNERELQETTRVYFIRDVRISLGY